MATLKLWNTFESFGLDAFRLEPFEVEQFGFDAFGSIWSRFV